jgi:CheY-like chemotaxis protein
LKTSVKILIVDSDPGIRYGLREVFRSIGHTVLTAEDGPVALERMEATVPDILFADFEMPRMSGYELLSIVRRQFPSVYVVAMSGSELRGTMHTRMPADGFYEKSSGLVSLLQAVDNGASSNRQSVWAYRKSTPVIMERGQSRRFTATAVFVGCPVCLRAFPQPFDSGRPYHETKCVHCRGQLDGSMYLA